MACSSCGGVTTVRAQTNPMPSKGAMPHGYEKTSGGFTAVRAQSGVSTATTNPLANSGGQGFTAVRAQSGVSTATTSPFGGSVNTKMTPQYGTSSMSGQRFTTTGGNGSSALSMSKYIGRGS
jgi:hypothetical protein